MSKTAALSNTTSAFRPLDTTRALRPARIACPQCGYQSKEPPVLALRESGNIEFHHCAECGGVWFYEKDSDLALRAAGSCNWPEPKAAAAPLPAGAAAHPWTCPCCGGTLVQIQDRSGSGASLRRCLICYGGWIEHADLKCVVASSAHVLTRVGRIIRQVAFGSK